MNNTDDRKKSDIIKNGEPPLRAEPPPQPSQESQTPSSSSDSDNKDK